MNVFISFPMNGKSYDEIVCERNSIINRCKEFLSDDAHYIDTVVKELTEEPLYYLGKAIEALSYADIAVFANDWHKARGCNIEYLCAEEYNVPILTL